MGLFDWLFATKSKWIPVSVNDLKTDGPLSKSDTKATFRSYLKQCGFDRDDIASEVESYADEITEVERCLKEDIQEGRKTLKTIQKCLVLLQKTKKDENGKLLEGEDYEDALEDLETDIEMEQKSLKESQEELTALQKDWAPFLIKYINDQAKMSVE